MGFDQTTNIILADSIERIFSVDEPVIEEPLGVEIVRGDNIVSSPPPFRSLAPARLFCGEESC